MLRDATLVLVSINYGVLKFNLTCVPEPDPIPVSYDFTIPRTLLQSACFVFTCHSSLRFRISPEAPMMQGWVA